MATATTNGADTVIKPDHQAGRKHFIFSQEHEDLRESLESWVKKELYPHRNEWEETHWPSEAMKRAGELGFLGLCFPEEYGGQGGDYYYSLVRAECMSYSGSGGTNMGFAVVRMPATSEPAPGSVIPRALISSPLMEGTR